MKKIKAYIVYGGHPTFWSASLIFENGWCAFGHCCSDPGFMLGDLWANRPERQNILREMGYEVEIVGNPIAGSDSPHIPPGLLKLNEDKANWLEMQEEYLRVKKTMYPEKAS